MIALWQAAIHAGWDVRRLPGWRIEPDVVRERIAVYGEPLFVAAIRRKRVVRFAQQTGLILLEPPPDWLTTLPARYVGRKVGGLT